MDGSAHSALVAVAEDDDDLRELLTEVLHRAGLRVTSLEDSGELRDYLELISARPPRAERPSLILTDLNMPGGSGFEAIRRARDQGLQVPVMMLTAFADEVTLEQAKRMGVTVIDKPHDLGDICQQILERIEG